LIVANIPERRKDHQSNGDKLLGKGTRHVVNRAATALRLAEAVYLRTDRSRPFDILSHQTLSLDLISISRTRRASFKRT
jgi:hypothetical protein